MAQFRRCIFSLVWVTFFTLTHSTFAFDSISKDNLVVEYLFKSGATIVDTSANNYPAITSGDTLFKTESGTSISYINFPWNGQFWWVFGWQADANVPFTISFGIKTSTGERVNTSNVTYGCPTAIPTFYNPWIPYNSTQCVSSYTMAGPPYSYYYAPYTTTITSTWSQYIFTTRKPVGFLNTDFGLKLRNDNKCELETGETFDCSFLQNGWWHSIIFRRNYFKKLELFIDGTRTNFWDNNGFTTGKLISLGKPTTYGTGFPLFVTNEAYKFKGNLSQFRVYNTDVSDTQIQSLSAEFMQFTTTDPSVPVITINQPDLLQSTTKKISAQTNTGTLQMIQTNGLVCDDSLWVFDDYIAVTFTSIDDNGKRVCYKATQGSKKVFKLSDKIGGIIGTSSSVVVDPIFGDSTYKSWIYSPQPKVWDYTRSILSWVSGVNFIDMNGDGLVDILYNKDYFLGIFVNNWDYTFYPAYKCKQTTVGSPGVSNFAITGYYGSCADINYK